MIEDPKPAPEGPGAKVSPLHARPEGNDLKPSEMRPPTGPQEWLLETFGLELRGRPSVILGLPGSRKGFFAMALMVASAVGGDFLGQRLSGGESSAYWDWDQTREETGKRWAPLARGYGIDLRALDRFVSYSWRPVHTMAPTNETEYNRAVSDLSRRVERARVRFVIVDSASKSCPGVRENSAEASIPFAVMTDVTDRCGTTFLVLDHPGWDGVRQRGHSSKEGGSGTILRLTKPSQTSPVTNVDCYRNQGLSPDRWCPPFAFSIASRNGGIVLDRAKPIHVPVFSDVALEAMKAELVKCVRKFPGHSKHGIQSMVKGDDKLKRAGLEELETAGVIVNRGSKGKSCLFPRPRRNAAKPHRTSDGA